ncbi:MAG: hypothetical protein D6698_10150, partial [Gammaproteobacteria bacterium]
QEFSEHQGSLTEETRQKILNAGIPETVLEATLAGQRALWKQQVEEAASAVGGKENLEAILTYVKNNFSKQEIDEFNAAMQNPAVYKRVLRGLLHEIADSLKKPTNSGSKEPKPTPTGTVAPVSTEPTPFMSIEEMTFAMNDARYRVDPVYTREVEARIHKTLNS